MKRTNINRDLAALKGMTPKQLRERYAELYGEPSRSGNKQWLIRRCAWRIQAYLTAAVMNLKRLASHAAFLWSILWLGPLELASEAPLCAHQFVPDARRPTGRRKAA